MKQLLALLTFILFPFCLFSQIIITGNVKNKTGEPLSANVNVQVKGSIAIAGFTTTNKDGSYSITYNGAADTLIVNVIGINIGKHSKIITRQQVHVDFIIDEKPLELNEVTVLPDKITRTGDTLNYSVNAYLDQNDRVIGDVLKKLPGIEVAPGGRISYNGKNINRFYVEDMDLLHGRYGIAVNNISAKDVASVQVLENHQPIKALKDKIISDQAAINLKLKESAKGVLTSNALAGIGYEPLLWNAELVAMYFARKKQNITTYKGNNSGNDVASEFRTHYDYERVYMNDESMLSVQAPATPPVPPKRYLYNHSNAVTTSQLFKTSENKELSVNAIYYNDRIEKEGSSVYEQYIPGDTVLTIAETVSSCTKINNAEFALRLKSNADNYYFNNALNLKGAWNSDNGSGITRSNANNMDEAISQQLDKPFFSIDNTINLIKNIEDRSYKVYFSTGYGSKPQTLTVTPANYLGDGNLSSLSQNVTSEDFAAVLRVSYGLKIGKFNMDYDVWGRADLRNLNTELQGKYPDGNLMALDDSLKNNLWYNNYQGGLNQSYVYQKNKVKANFNLPLTYYVLTVDDRIPGKFTTYNKWIINPSVSVKYDLTSELNLSAGANYAQSFGDMNSAYTGYIMHNYRSLLRNTVDRLFEIRSGGGRASVGYRNVFHALFINSEISYNRFWRNLLYGYDYQGILQVKTTIDQPTESENYGIGLNIQKGLNFWSATIRFQGNYFENKSEQLIQNQILNYRSKNYGAGSSLIFSPVHFISLNYSFSWNQNKSYALELPTHFDPMNIISQNGRINLFPIKVLTINLNVEYQYNSLTDNRYSTFADAAVKFKHKRLDLELELNNLFNTKQYVSASYNDISAYYYNYDLRPGSILFKVRFKLK